MDSFCVAKIRFVKRRPLEERLIRSDGPDDLTFQSTSFAASSEFFHAELFQDCGLRRSSLTEFSNQDLTKI